MDFAAKKCAPCSGEDEVISSETAVEMLKLIPGWELKDNVIERTFSFPDFVHAMRFADKIAEIAEEENHHPDLHISWGKTRVELTTHKINGLSNNDFIMAAKINGIGNRQ